MEFFDTIAAIATPIGVGGIAIIRISGETCEKCIEAIAFPKNKKPLSEIESHKLVLSDIKRLSDGAILDEALVSVMRAPHSYTGETVVEINCHGGYVVAQAILDEIFKCGVRQAKAGEFMRRSFMNGKTDLLKAEATIDIINSSSNLGHENAAKVLSGKLSQKVEEIRESAVLLGAQLSAIADFPDEIDEIPESELFERSKDILDQIDAILEGFEKGRIMRDGVKTVIVGRPNVGKSSLLNAITRTNRAIVTDIPGTTRDTVEEYVSVNGIALKLIDTAGIRDSENQVEKIGIERAKESIQDADLCLFVLDSSLEITPEDLKIFEYVKDKNAIVLLNKTDKKSSFDRGYFSKKLNIEEKDVILTATPKDGNLLGIKELEDEITRRFMQGGVNKDDVFISNERQKSSLINAKKAAQNMISCIENGLSSDLIYVDLEDLILALGEVTGLTVQEEIIDSVFERFCVGK